MIWNTHVTNFAVPLFTNLSITSTHSLFSIPSTVPYKAYLFWKDFQPKVQIFYVFASDHFKFPPGAGEGDQQFKARPEKPTSEKVQDDQNQRLNN